MTDITIGSFLKDLRLRKGYSLERLSAETKISLSILKKLEQNDLPNLPNITYVKGYVQNCLKSLHNPYNTEVNDIIENTYHSLGLIEIKKTAVKKENNLVNEITNQESKKDHKIYNLSSLISKNSILTICSLLIIIAIFSFVKKVQMQNKQRHSVAITSTTQGSIEENKIENYVALPQQQMPTINSTTTVQVTQQTPENNVTPTPTSAPTQVQNTTFPKFEFKKISDLGISLQDESEKDLDSYTEEDRKRVTQGKQNLFITKLDGESWISYKKDNEPPRSTLLKKGQKFFITGDKLFVTIGNTEKLKLYFNGKIVNFVGSRGVKSFIFPIDDASQHSLPLFVRDSSDKLYFYEDYIPLMNQESNAASSEARQQ